MFFNVAISKQSFSSAVVTLKKKRKWAAVDFAGLILNQYDLTEIKINCAVDFGKISPLLGRNFSIHLVTDLFTVIPNNFQWQGDTIIFCCVPQKIVSLKKHVFQYVLHRCPLLGREGKR